MSEGRDVWGLLDEAQAMLRRVEAERDEARTCAREYYADIRQLVSDYQWEKHYARDEEDHPWLKGALDFLYQRAR